MMVWAVLSFPFDSIVIPGASARGLALLYVAQALARKSAWGTLAIALKPVALDLVALEQSGLWLGEALGER